MMMMMMMIMTMIIVLVYAMCRFVVMLAVDDDNTEDNDEEDEEEKEEKEERCHHDGPIIAPLTSLISTEQASPSFIPGKAAASLEHLSAHQRGQRGGARKKSKGPYGADPPLTLAARGRLNVQLPSLLMYLSSCYFYSTVGPRSPLERHRD